MKNQIDLKQKLEDIGKVFKIEDVLGVEANKEYVQKYYKINKIPYSLFHTKTDFVHMGISRDGVYKESDLIEAAKIVEKYLIQSNGSKVLELATGRGSNSIYLAKKFPTAKFYGIDLSDGQLEYAVKKAKIVNNFYPASGNFHDLSRFKNETFDIVFVVEALCYSKDKSKVLSEVRRILKKGGFFIIIDGYSNKNPDQMTSDEKVALRLAEVGMALKKFELYGDFVNKIKEDNFKIEFEEDASQFVIPNMDRFERKASLFFKFHRLAKLFSVFLPKEFSYNALFGYLTSTLMRMNTCIYMITVLKKEEK
jgi:arsenite methyltransferase